MKGVKVVKTVTKRQYEELKNADYIELEVIVDNGTTEPDIGNRLYFYRDKYVNNHFEKI